MEIFNFFLQVPPPFEKLALLELEEKQALFFSKDKIEKKLVPGGIEISTSLNIGFYLNKVLRTPNRVLLVIADFKCRDIPKLYNKISKLDWTSYINSSDIKVISSSKDSRLFDSRKIEKAVIDGINLSFKARQVKKKYMTEAFTPKRVHHIFIKIIQDHCFVSIDTSGERLGLSGYKSFVNMAPIRENLAASLLLSMKKQFPETENLIDPMCGSGTFLIEAARFYEVNNERDFQYLCFPVSEKLTFPSENKTILKLFEKTVGYDLSQETIETTKKNFHQNWNIEIEKHDFFNLDKKSISKDSLLILNPPYGKRLAVDEARRSFFEKVIKKLSSLKNISKIGIIIPEDIIKPLNSTVKKHFEIKKTIKFKNGGYKVQFCILESKL